MGLKATSNNIDYLSFEINDETWQKLKKDKEFKSTLLMPCCNHKAVMKNSSLGLPYFSHYRKGSCNSKGETEEHLLLKKYLYEFLKAANYNVEIEKTITFEEYYIRADIYLEVNDQKIAFEIQSSNQTFMTTQERSDKYTNNGIIVVWLNLFTNRTYNYQKFNITNKLAKIYEVIKSNNTYLINDSTIPNLVHTIELKSFILESIIKTIAIEVPDYDLNPNDFISCYSDDSCTLYDKLVINNKYYFNNQRVFNKKNIDYEAVLSVMYFKGFINSTRNLNFTVKAITYDDYTEPIIYTETEEKNIPSNKLKFKNVCFDDIKKALEFNKVSYKRELTINGYFIDILASHMNNKIAFILTYELDSIYKLINFCRIKNYQVVVINFFKDLGIDEEFVTTINYHPDTYYRGMKCKENSFFEMMQNLMKKSLEYPLCSINRVSIEHFYDKKNTNLIFNEYAVENVIFDKNAFSSYPVLDIKNIKKEICFNCFYKQGLIHYEFSLLLYNSDC